MEKRLLSLLAVILLVFVATQKSEILFGSGRAASTIQNDLNDGASIQHEPDGYFGESLKEQPMPFRACAPQQIVTSPTRSLPPAPNLAFPSPFGSPPRQEYFVVYATPTSMSEVRALGVTPLGTVGSGDRLVQSSIHGLVVGSIGDASAFGNLVAYRMTVPGAIPPFQAYIFAKHTGQDGVFGSGDERPYLVAAPFGSLTLTTGWYRPLDLVPGRIVYFALDSTTRNVYPVLQGFGANGVPEAIQLPGSDDSVELVSVDRPLSLARSVNYLQASSSKLVALQEQQPNSNPPYGSPPYDYVTHVFAPGANGAYESGQNNPNYDDESWQLGGGGVSEFKPALSYDGAFLITGGAYPTHPNPMSTITVNLYDLRTVGCDRGRLMFYLQPGIVPLTVPSGGTLPSLVAVDVDGRYVDPATGQTISGALVAFMQYSANGLPVVVIDQRNFGVNGIPLDGDDVLSSYQLTLRTGDYVFEAKLKNGKVVFSGSIQGQVGLYFLC